MGKTEVDLRELNNANQKLPSCVSTIDGMRRAVSLLRWRIPAEIQNRMDIHFRLDRVVKEIDAAGKKLQAVYLTVDAAVIQYREVDRNLKKNAESFQ